MVAALLVSVCLLASFLSAQDVGEVFQKCSNKCAKEFAGRALKDVEPAVWDSTNCNLGGDSGTVLGLVVDAICANVQVDGEAKGCSSLDQTTCDSSQGRCKWGGVADSARCTWNRDEKNNVCLGLAADTDTALPEGVNNCNDIANERCPAAWQVPTGCCLEEHEKYSGILSSSPGFTCCNAPCTSLEARHAAGGQVNLLRLASVYTQLGNTFKNGTVCSAKMGSRLCAPGMRSFAWAGGNGGMLDRTMQYKVMGMYGGQSVFQSVHEISVDDFMDVFIKALDSDDDVFESRYQMTSDNWHGKQELGNMFGLELDDPMSIFDGIYGGRNYGGGHGSPYTPYGQSYGYIFPYGQSYGLETYGYTGGYGAPAYGSMQGYGAPSSYGIPTQGAYPAYGKHTYGAPPTYGAPAYGAPAYGAPAYGAPAHGAPTSGAPPAYGKPTHGAPSYGQEASYNQPTSYRQQPSYTNAQPSYDQKKPSYNMKQPSYNQKQPSYDQDYKPSSQDYKPSSQD